MRAAIVVIQKSRAPCEEEWRDDVTLLDEQRGENLNLKRQVEQT